MEKVLQLVFKKADGKQKVLNVTDPRENVTAEEARTAMQSIVDSGVFNADGNALAEVVEARVRTTFPVMLSWYLLIRMESKLDKLTESISALTANIAQSVN